MKKIFCIITFIFALFIVTNAAEGEYIIKYREDAPAFMYYDDDSEFLGAGMYLVSAEKALALKEAGYLDICDENIEMTYYDTTPNDTYYSSQWNLPMINAGYPWSLGLFGNDVLVGIIDSGLAPNHPDIDYSRVEEGVNFGVSSDDESFTDTTDSRGHGTMVAGVIAAKRNNSFGIAGIADKVKILPMKVENKSGVIELAAVITAINAGARYGCDVLNISLGGGTKLDSLDEAVKTATNLGCIVVCAAGNNTLSDPGNHVRYPAGCEGAVSVASVTRTITRAETSVVNESVFISAPADGIPVLNYTGGIRDSGGTSFAAPQVAAAAAIAKQIYPDITPAQFKDALRYSAKDLNPTIEGRDTEFGYGLLNLFDMTRYVLALKNKGVYVSSFDQLPKTIHIRNLTGSDYIVTSIFTAYQNNRMNFYDPVPLKLESGDAYTHKLSVTEDHTRIAHFLWKSLDSASPVEDYLPLSLTKNASAQ
ncbi:MAG: S8 family serine peptidase [Clostridia bacterium]|nr:S8 family serine peptidase [Clostridia bacterium]